jgi:lycopene elongase/hydratase (dihydrobisanhydrobacterioruberin-forming)
LNNLFNYLKSARCAEVTMMLGFPATGLLFAFSSYEQLLNKNTFIFLIAIFFLSSAIYSFNALAGIKEDEKNERLKENLGSDRKIFFIVTLFLFSVIFLALFFTIDKHLGLFSIISFFLWFSYSFPKLGFKYRPVAGTAIHFLGQIIHFHMGYMIISNFSATSMFISIYFALLFSSGHINHELIDHDADKKMNVNSGAVYFGKNIWEKVSFIMFGSSTVYMVFLITAGIVEMLYGIPFVVAGTFHIVYRAIFLKAQFERKRFVKERSFYRIAYFFAGLFFMILKLNF